MLELAATCLSFLNLKIEKISGVKSKISFSVLIFKETQQNTLYDKKPGLIFIFNFISSTR